MKIVDRKTFLAMPSNTVFTKYAPCFFGELCIKGETCGENDFLVQQIADAIESHDSGGYIEQCEKAERGESVPFDFNCQGRDGLFEDDQLFAVWEESDVKALIERLAKGEA